MSRRTRFCSVSSGPRRVALALGVAIAGRPVAAAAEPNFPITPEQRGTAQRAAQAGVPLSELAPNAPDSTPSSAATRCGTSPGCS